MDEFLAGPGLRTVHLPVVLEQAFGVTRSQGRRWLTEGAVRIEGEVCKDLTCARMDIDGKILQAGKRRFARIKIGR